MKGISADESNEPARETGRFAANWANLDMADIAGR
jgi:hypothetical protein